MHNYWMSIHRKDLVEKAIVQRRDQEIEREKKFESAARYHRDLNLLSAQYKNLEDQPSGKIQRVNEESQKKEAAVAERKEQLNDRRQKLAQFLAKESEVYLYELKALEADKEKDPWNISTLKEQIDALRKEREEREAELRKKDMYNLFQQTNIPYVKEYVDKLSEEEVLAAMTSKRKALEQETTQQIVLAQQQFEDLKQLQDNAVKELEKVKEEKMLIQERNTKALQRILDDLDLTSVEDIKIKHQIKVLEDFSNLIEGVHSKRVQVANIQRQKKEKISQLRPSREKVRMMNAEYRHEWDLDLATLNYLSKLEMAEELASEKIKFALQSVTERLAFEDKRAGDIQQMFEEEAKRSWVTHKADWDSEAEKQNNLMTDVFKYIITRIQEKMKDCFKIQDNISETKIKLSVEASEIRKRTEEEVRTVSNKEIYYQNKLDEVIDRIQRFNTARKKLPPVLTQ